MLSNWRLWVIPLTIALCIASLAIPIHVAQEEPTPHAKSAVVHLNSRQNQAVQPKDPEVSPAHHSPLPSPTSLPIPVPPKRKPAPQAIIAVPSLNELKTLLPEKKPPVPVLPEDIIQEQETAEPQREQNPINENDIIPIKEPFIEPIPTEFAQEPDIAQTEPVSVGYSEMDSNTIAPSFNTREIAKRIVYPPLAKRQRIQGDVMLLLYISSQGHVDQVDILSESGYGFGEAARNAFLGFECQPATRAGIPIAVKIRYPIRFSLH